MYQEDQDRIRARAHQIWEREGKPEGRHAEHWEMAREEIAIEDNQNLATEPNPVADGKYYADGTEDAEPITAAEEGMADMPGPSNQGEREAYPKPRPRRRVRTTEAGEVAGIRADSLQIAAQ
jgi:hypothetical protein